MSAFLLSTAAIVSAAPEDGCLQWRKETVRLRTPLSDEVLVRIVASGICHTDITMSQLAPGVSGPARYPKVVGHEGAGVVERVGSNIAHLRAGDKVLLSFDFCGKNDCRACKDHLPGYCREFQPRNILGVPEVYETSSGPGAGLFFGQSSFSQLAIVKGTSALNVSHIVKTEDELKILAPMGCAYQTGAGAVTNLANVKSGDVVAVFGLGGVGMAAIMAAKIRGASTIIALDRVQTRLVLAQEIGATHLVDTSDMPSLIDDLVAAIRQVASGGVSVIIDTTGVVPLLKAAIKTLKAKGQLILMGLMHGKTLDLDLGLLLDHVIVDRKLTVQSDEHSTAVADLLSGVTIKPILLW
ncbi:GroES-like protein [Aaosphaeria arxii CBS 175.79]|uniref:GroES-like protein n=1 Tax=Aaosphaeria arxii CBS 175.79 TaxID=1450172 RepID=A0A6A5Y3D9_9PLEO|nr:GroES-like protein [Aaosphaeria arxii CBS 175.79]KAF2019978.1 GroES-like protein [Aaosphaeria arxii CBS 175.79]